MPKFDYPLNQDENLRLTMSVYDTDVNRWMMPVQNYVQNSNGIWIPLILDENEWLKASVKSSALPTGAATQTTLAEILSALLYPTETDPVTISDRLLAQEGLITSIYEMLLNTIPYATKAKQDNIVALLNNILTKIISAPATEAKQDSIINALANIVGYTDGLETLITAMNSYVDGLEGSQAGIISVLNNVISGNSLASVKMAGSKIEDITFHDAAIVVGDGLIFNIGGYKTLSIEITGTSTSRVVSFKCHGASGVERPISGVNLNGYDVNTTTSGTDELWYFDNIAGLTSIFMKLEAVDGGNVTVKGRAVA